MFVLTTVVEIIVKNNLFFLVCYRPRHCYMRYLITFTNQLNVSPAVEFCINPLNPKRRLLYLKAQSVPRSKHFSSWL